MHPRWTRLTLVAMLFLHAGLLLCSAWQHSPVHAEVQQLPAGLFHITYGRFDFADVNPPLVRLAAAVPASWLSPNFEWQGDETRIVGRPEYEIGRRFIEANGMRCQPIFFAGRCACIPFSLLGAIFCWRWAKALYGEAAGLIATALWCFSPSILGHGQLISADIAAAAMVLTASYAIWVWLHARTWVSAVIAGIALGVAQLTKFTLLILFPLTFIWAILFYVCCKPIGPPGRAPFPQDLLRFLCQFALICGTAVYVIDIAYGFDGVPFRPSEEIYRSRLLRPWGASDLTNRDAVAAANRVQDWIWLPLPKSYIRGLDQQKSDFEMKWDSFLFGQWKLGGWWYYYLWALGVKTPLGTMLVGLCAVLSLVVPWRSSRDRLSHWWDEMIPLSLLCGLLFLVSSQINMGCHMRYAFPLLGVFFVLCGRAALLFQTGSRSAITFVVGFIGWSMASSLSQYPHTIGYFNELAGGPNRGHYWLNHSNVDWGQDLYYLKEWYDQHPDARPLFVSADALYNPEFLGIHYSKPYQLLRDQIANPNHEPNHSSGPRPGWYAVSKNNLQLPEAEYRYLLSREQTATIGSAINVYHLSLEDVNQIRAAHALPLLPADWEQQRQHGQETEAVLLSELDRSIETCRAETAPLHVKVLHFQYSADRDDSGERDICQTLQMGLQCESDVITVDGVKSGALESCDVLLVPGGSSEMMATLLGAEGKAAIRQFLQQGGGYVGICAGSFLATDRFESCLDVIDASLLSGTCEVPGMGRVSLSERGDGEVNVKITDNGKAVFPQTKDVLLANYSGGPIFQDDALDRAPSYTTLATYLSEVNRYDKQRGTMVQTPAVIAGTFGQGRVILFGFHPESKNETKDILFRSIQAVVGSHRNKH